MGLFAAAYSSFLVNSMIGGFMLADGLNLGSKPTDLWPRLLTAAALLTGMGVALAAKVAEMNTLPLIIVAQAVTVVASPLVAGTLIWLTNRRDVMGENTNGPVANAIAGLGLVMLVAMAGYTAFVKIPDRWEELQQQPAAVSAESGEELPSTKSAGDGDEPPAGDDQPEQ